MEELRETIERSDADLVLIGTPIDLRRVIDIDKPALRVTYRLQELGEPTLAVDPRRARDGSATSARRRRRADGRRAGRERAPRAGGARYRRRAPGEPRHDVRRGRAAARGRGRGHARERPQVGNELLRQEPGRPRRRRCRSGSRSRRRRPRSARSPRPSCARGGRPVAVVVTHVAVDPDDPAFQNPTKPIGPHYDSLRAKELERSAAGRSARSRDAAGGASCPPPGRSRSSSWRRCARCSTRARLVVAVGGGGIPVVARGTRPSTGSTPSSTRTTRRRSSPSASGRSGSSSSPRCRRSTGDFDGDGGDGDPIAELSPERDAGLVDALPAGSMRPKVEAAFAFVSQTGGEALITAPRRPERRGRNARSTRMRA